MGFERSTRWLWLALLVAGSVSAACGVSDRHVSIGASGQAGTAGKSTLGGSGGAGNSGGAGDSGGSVEPGGSGQTGGNPGDSSAGAAGQAGDAGDAGAGGAVERGCTVGAAPYCADSFTPARCVGGVWVAQTACGGSKPVCSNGVCANATLFGGIVTVVSPPSASGIHLVDQGFEFAQPVSTSMKSCGVVHQGLTVCVTGGLTAHGVAPAMASGGSGS